MVVGTEERDGVEERSGSAERTTSTISALEEWGSAVGSAKAPSTAPAFAEKLVSTHPHVKLCTDGSLFRSSSAETTPIWPEKR